MKAEKKSRQEAARLKARPDKVPRKLEHVTTSRHPILMIRATETYVGSVKGVN